MIQSEEVQFTVGQALVEAVCGKVADRSSLGAFEAAEGESVKRDVVIGSLVAHIVDHILSVTIASIKSQVCVHRPTDHPLSLPHEHHVGFLAVVAVAFG